MIHILLPAYNEELSLPKLLPKIKDELTESKREFRILVVNDGSSDQTPEILGKFKNEAGYRLEVLTHEINSQSFV